MRLEYFEYLLEIDRYKNMRIAAEHLHMTPQALSVCIKNMEQEVGIQILERKPKGVVFTADGEKLLALAGRILRDYQSVLRELSGRAVAVQRQRVQIYCTPIINLCLGDGLIGKCQQEYPDILLSLLCDVPERILERVCEAQDGSVIGLMMDDGASAEMLREQGVVVQHCFTDEMLLAVAKTSPLATAQKISLRELEQSTIIHCTEQKSDEQPIREIFHGLENVEHLHCNSVRLWGKMIGDGLGVGPIVKRALQQAFRDGEIDPKRVVGMRLETMPQLECFCFYRQDAPACVAQIALELTKL